MEARRAGVGVGDCGGGGGGVVVRKGSRWEERYLMGKSLGDNGDGEGARRLRLGRVSVRKSQGWVETRDVSRSVVRVGLKP